VLEVCAPGAVGRVDVEVVGGDVEDGAGLHRVDRGLFLRGLDVDPDVHRVARLVEAAADRVDRGRWRERPAAGRGRRGEAAGIDAAERGAGGVGGPGRLRVA